MNGGSFVQKTFTTKGSSAGIKCLAKRRPKLHDRPVRTRQQRQRLQRRRLQRRRQLLEHRAIDLVGIDVPMLKHLPPPLPPPLPLRPSVQGHYLS